MFKLLTAATFSASIVLAGPVAASLIVQDFTNPSVTPTNIGGFAMTDFANNTSNNGLQYQSANPITAPNTGDQLVIADSSGNPVQQFANYEGTDQYFRTLTTETNDSDFYFTYGGTSCLYCTNGAVMILLPANTRAFSFNVSTYAPGFINLTATDNFGADTTFSGDYIGYQTPGFGVSSSGCSTISSITINEPAGWRYLGNFSINQRSCKTASIPAPSTFVLFLLGMLGLVIWHRAGLRAK